MVKIGKPTIYTWRCVSVPLQLCIFKRVSVNV